jgi:hypothetical protein
MSKGPIVHFAGKDMPISEWLERSTLIDAARAAWNEPDPEVVKLQDVRKVLRQFYDPAIHGKESE